MHVMWFIARRFGQARQGRGIGRLGHTFSHIALANQPKATALGNDLHCLEHSRLVVRTSDEGEGEGRAVFLDGVRSDILIYGCHNRSRGRGADRRVRAYHGIARCRPYGGRPIVWATIHENIDTSSLEDRLELSRHRVAQSLSGLDLRQITRVDGILQTSPQVFLTWMFRVERFGLASSSA